MSNRIVFSVMAVLRFKISRGVALVRRHRVEIAEIVGDAIGAASILALLVMLCFLGEVLR